MFIVSHAAAMRLLDLLEGARPKQGLALRLTQKTPERIGLAIDSEREGDQVVLTSGRAVLLIAPEVADLLSGMSLVVEAGLDGQRLGLQPSSAAEGPAMPPTGGRFEPASEE